MFEERAKKQIKSIQFGLFSPEEIRNGSVVLVTHPEVMENGVPKAGGLIDLRMGTTDRMYLCQSCGGDSFSCPGHFGHIELTKPMFHVGYVSKIKKVLECVCFYCSKIKIAKTGGKAMLNGVWNACKTKGMCEGDMVDGGRTGCGNKQPVIKKEGLSLVAFMKGEESGEGKVMLNGERVYSIFKKISDADSEYMGFDLKYSRPEWMILTVLLVPPPTVRPSIVMEGSLRGEDDLTHKLADIIKSNGYLKKYEQEGAPGHIVRDYEQLLQFHVATLIDNDIGGQPQALQKSGRPLKSISARLKGKEGRIRGNLMGKRVDFSARTVITPDPNIRLEEVGVPVEVAKIHTFPEKVTSFNIDKLNKLVKMGPNEHPGANYVIRSDGQKIDLSFNRSDIRLEEGYIVERHMQSGDVVLFNRQPSLHKMSMMAHYVRVMENKTFRLNLSVTSPYNADFDGDEMNLHMPQSYTSKSELEELVLVPNQIISPQSNKPVMGIVQDTLTGLRLLTLRNTFLDERETMSLLYAVDSQFDDMPVGESARAEFKRTKEYDIMKVMARPSIAKPKRLWTGKQVLSFILPSMNYSGLSSEHNEEDKENANDTIVRIQDGIIHSGIVDKKAAGAVQGGLIHIIFNDFGPRRAAQFFNGVQKMVNAFVTGIHCFSIGIGDTIADANTVKMVKEAIAKAKDDVAVIIRNAQQNMLERMPGMTMKESFESQLNLVLNKARDVSGSSAQRSLSGNNNMKTMVLAGSKGSFINISQVSACVGQQNVEGKRIPFGFLHRTLPHFVKDDYTGRSRGFVENSYLSGLGPEEFFFHAMGGREGLIDTAIKTAETGYIQRRLIKALEDAIVRQDESVRSGSGFVYQLKYGEDGFDATFLEAQKVEMRNFRRRYYIDMFGKEELRVNESEVSSEVYKMLCSDVDLQKQLDEEYEWLVQEVFEGPAIKDIGDVDIESDYRVKRMYNESVMSPCNFGRLICTAKRIFEMNAGDVSPYYILSAQRELMTSNKILNVLIRSNLNVKRILVEHRLDTEAFSWVVGEIKSKIMKAKITPNEMVGTLAAQSVGEPATQMTLNTFHLAGVASTVTMGVPRLKEIFNVTKNLRTPSMRIYLEGGYCKSVESAKAIQNEIECVSIKDLCMCSEIYYDPEVTSTDIAEDRDFVEAYFEFPDEEIDFLGLSPYLIRLVIDRSKVVGRRISLEEVAGAVRRNIKSDAHVICSDENAVDMVVRIRMMKSSEECLSFYMNCLESLLKQQFGGYKNVKKVYITEDKERKEWYLQTDGVCLSKILGHPAINSKHTVSNDMLEIAETLGIEAARESILNELALVIDGNGSYVNYRHMSLLADVMTMRGYLCGVTRHGVNKTGSGALKRSSFEETVEILLDAALVSERNFCKGITENIMMGQLAPMGTGNVEIMLDMNKLDKAIPLANPVFKANDPATPVINTPMSDSFSISSGAWSPMHIDMGYNRDMAGRMSLTSPAYSPTSPAYSPTSPAYSPTSPAYSPTSPAYSPTSPAYSPTSPAYSPTSPAYSPTSPAYSPTSPAYSPTSPAYSVTAPSFASKNKSKDQDGDRKRKNSHPF
ncbi:DNA-directed RNA polymerase [Ordospora pajunii]|uniref:DNA-directed RNA polymerase II subunit RPB1 n=1 Tax=Ordospora pajunii TaxID=3039483 RepID=UPI00295278DE|nr:DNA-directed RNA polymerase II subunit RPB1 [Ordospora pajunii]KAH9411829.1 DNA-directed RNA polymerase [Ordospora pajunii]